MQRLAVLEEAVAAAKSRKAQSRSFMISHCFQQDSWRFAINLKKRFELFFNYF
jgi:hypothetical protein